MLQSKIFHNQLFIFKTSSSFYKRLPVFYLPFNITRRNYLVRNTSCLTSLLDFMEEVTNCIDSSYLVDVICLYFQKTFD